MFKVTFSGHRQIWEGAPAKCPRGSDLAPCIVASLVKIYAITKMFVVEKK